MGDFERTFGAGANIMSIINGLSGDDDDGDDQKRTEVYVASHDEAQQLVQAYPKSTIRPFFGGYLVDFNGRRFHLRVPVPDGYDIRNSDWHSEWADDVLAKGEGSINDKWRHPQLGNSSFHVFEVPPPSFDKVEKALAERSMKFVFVSNYLSLLVNDFDNEPLEGLLISDDEGSGLATIGHDDYLFRRVMGWSR